MKKMISFKDTIQEAATQEASKDIKEPMLNIWFGFSKKAIIRPDSYFDHSYKKEWFEDDLVKKMIKDVDEVEVVGSKLAYDWEGDPISPLCISGGVKTLIMMYKLRGFLADGDTMGDNCCKWLEEISKRVTCTMTLTHCMGFGSDPRDIRPFRVKFLNNGDITKTYCDYYRNLAELLGKYYVKLEELPDDLCPSLG